MLSKNSGMPRGLPILRWPWMQATLRLMPNHWHFCTLAGGRRPADQFLPLAGTYAQHALARTLSYLRHRPYLPRPVQTLPGGMRGLSLLGLSLCATQTPARQSHASRRALALVEPV